jgi:hypothetical protein
MSFQAMAWAVKQAPAGSKEKFVLLMLANYASNENGDCHPSLGEICDATMLSRDSVIRALKSLEDDGFISIEKKRVGKVNLPNSYSLNLHRVVAHSDHEGSRNLQGGSSTERPGVVAVSDPNLSAEPIKAAAARPGDLIDKLLDAAGIKGNPTPQLAFPGEIIGLMQAGYDLDADILPAIRARPKPTARSWNYFVPQIREAAERKRSAASVQRPEAKTIDWAVRVAAFYEDGTWGRWGPKPGEEGCQAPAELIRGVAA